ncbi:MAG: ABC transporter ATP-binding protein [bacterium]|nr:ABC transporter ATP-binding protein [bacterium]
MKTYLRMLRMVRPYTGQLVMAVIAMFIFSAASVFSTAMLSPFLETLFLKGDEPAAATAPAPEQAPTLTVTDGTTNAITGDSGPRAETDAERAARYNALRGRVSWVDEIKLAFKSWAATHLLQGTKQQALLRICLTFFFFTLLKNIACYLQEILMAYVGHAVIRDLRGQLYRKFTDLPLAFYHRHKAGELISRATNDVLVAQQCVGASFMKLVKEPIYIVMFLTVALIISWQMTLLAFALMPASLAVVLGISRTLRRISHRQQEQMADLTSTLQETVYGIRVIKAFAMEKFETAKFTRQAQELFKQVFRFDYTMKASSPLTEQLSMAVGLFLLWFGGSRVFTGGLMAPDMFIFFLFAIFSMVRPLKNVGQVGAELQAGLAAAERIFAVLDEPTETATLAGTRDLGRSRGEVELQDVHFSYLPGEPVLRGVSLKVGAGQVVALAGSSGAGKSTLMDMIPGFYTPQQGRVLVDGIDVRELDPQSLRRNMGIVTQEVILFHDTVLRNIAYGLDSVPLEKVREAARAANADEFIMKLPHGYETIIGDRGVTLSGGQRQRLSIARAILKDPAILLLDEATSALDTESEKLVQEAIDRLVRNRTTIVIAHRLSTIRGADRICLLEQGQVVQVGTHDELLAAGGRYKELYDLQFKN